MNTINYTPIGIIHTSHKTIGDVPIQPAAAKGFIGKIVLNKEYSEGLADINGFSHIILLYHFHKSIGFNLSVIPFLDKNKRGLFATRAPKRPNAIGLSVVKIQKTEDNIIYIEDVDMLDQTPLLDLKPYVPKFDAFPHAKSGWVEQVKDNKIRNSRSDNRFACK